MVKVSTQAYTAELNKDIKVETNDPANPLLTLTVKARVFEAVKVSPRLVNFGKMSQNQTGTRDITVENRGKKPLRITRIAPSSSPQSKLTVIPGEPFTLKPGETRKLTLKLDSGTAVGFLNDNVVLETDVPYLPQKKVYVSVEIKPEP